MIDSRENMNRLYIVFNVQEDHNNASESREKLKYVAKQCSSSSYIYFISYSLADISSNETLLQTKLRLDTS